MSALRWFGSQWLAGSESIAKVTLGAAELIATGILAVVGLIATGILAVVGLIAIVILTAIGALVVGMKATWPFLLLDAGFAVAIYGIIRMVS